MSFYETIKHYRDFDFEDFFSSITDEDIYSAINNAQNEKTSISNFLALLSDKADSHLEEIARLSQKLTWQYFGRTLSLYLPIYISNYCSNGCIYCGFNCKNKINRRHLDFSEIEQEAKEIAKHGVSHILMLTGESRELADFNYICESVKILSRHFQSVSIEIYPLETEEYAELKALGVDGLTIYQETYNEDIYKEVHISGDKMNYRKRLDTPEKGAKAGLRQIGIGALYGLGELKSEAFLSAMHAKYLMDKYINSEISISLPRITHAAGDFTPMNFLGDKQFVRFLMAFRLFLPRVGINISTRESAEFRNNLIGLGITKFSAGSKTSVGGYTGGTEESTAQFETTDKRSVNEIISAMKEKSYQPVHKDWQLI